MRKFTPSIIVVLVAMVVVVPVIAGESPQRPGLWQVKKQLEVSGVPAKMPPVTFEFCLSKEDVADPQNAVPSDPKAGCTVRDYKIDGKTVTWSLDCPTTRTKGTGVITYADNSYSGVVQIQVDGGQELKIKYSGKWLGECSKE